MDLDSAAVFMAGSILISLGIAAIAVVVLALNNIYSKYWKTVKFTLMPPVQYRYIEPTQQDDPRAPGR